MKKFIQAVVIIIIVAAALFLIYEYALPSGPRNWVTAQYQQMFDKDAKAKINSIKQASPIAYPTYTYEDLFEKSTQYPVWLYDKSANTVTYYGSSLELLYAGDEGKDKLYTGDEKLMAVFTFGDGGRVDLKLYIDGVIQEDADADQLMVGLVEKVTTGN